MTSKCIIGKSTSNFLVYLFLYSFTKLLFGKCLNVSSLCMCETYSIFLICRVIWMNQCKDRFRREPFLTSCMNCSLFILRSPLCVFDSHKRSCSLRPCLIHTSVTLAVEQDAQPLLWLFYMLRGCFHRTYLLRLCLKSSGKVWVKLGSSLDKVNRYGSGVWSALHVFMWIAAVTGASHILCIFSDCCMGSDVLCALSCLISCDSMCSQYRLNKGFVGDLPWGQYLCYIAQVWARTYPLFLLLECGCLCFGSCDVAVTIA